MIKIEKLTKSYGKKRVFRDLDLAFRPGVITGLAGPNACGKTTLIKCILGLAVPDRGRILLGDRPVTGDWEYRREIGYMPQYPDFPANLEVRELLGMIEGLRGEKPARKEELLAYFELGPFLRQSFGHLSGGTRQKVAAVVAFMFDAPIVILDEPTAGLDPLCALKFKKLLARTASRGKTVLLVSHIMTELDQLAHDLVYLTEGRTIYAGEIDGLKKRTEEPSLEEAITLLAKEAL